jgi:ADP-L-glycero-D-manno-heptose 6-epimerase
MIVVTGGAGFIGSNLVKALTNRGIDDIVVADDMTEGRKFANLVDCDIADYWDRDVLLDRLAAAERPRAVLHQGACTVTTEWDGRYMMQTNYRYSVELLEFCQRKGVPFIYASSAAVYGASRKFAEDDPALERPLNVYGYSKLLFDRYVRRVLGGASAQIAGLRYFNVYGPREAHKGPMASVVHHFDGQLREHGRVRLFEGSGGYGPGEQRRDFVYVADVVDVNLWFLDHPEKSGIFNVGTGASASFNDLARAVIATRGGGTAQDRIEYIPFPVALRDSYQSFTEADLTALRGAGYEAPFMDIEAGTAAYLGGA